MLDKLVAENLYQLLKHPNNDNTSTSEDLPIVAWIKINASISKDLLAGELININDSMSEDRASTAKTPKLLVVSEGGAIHKNKNRLMLFVE